MINSIDEKDRQILELLNGNGRMSYSDIGEKVSLSRTAVKNRISALEERGIIAGYKAIVNPLMSTENTSFIVNIETTPEVFEDVKKEFADAAETILLLQTTGKCHLMGICVSPDMKSMREFIKKMYKISEGVLYINASAVMETIKGAVIPE